MPYLVSDLFEDKISSMREGALTGGAHTDVTVLDIIHLTSQGQAAFCGDAEGR